MAADAHSLRVHFGKCPQVTGSEATKRHALDEATMQLLFFVYDTIGRMYAMFMFEIMRDFPETEAAVLDCAACMKRTSLHQHVVDSLTASVRSRLLHPGAPPASLVMYSTASPDSSFAAV
jgi:hypothetical protein